MASKFFCSHLTNQGLRSLILFVKDMLAKNAENNAWQTALAVFIRLSVWIGAPIVIAVFLGKWLDKKYNTEPWLFLATVGIAFILSMFGLIKETLKEFKKIEDKKNND